MIHGPQVSLVSRSKVSLPGKPGDCVVNTNQTKYEFPLNMGNLTISSTTQVCPDHITNQSQVHIDASTLATALTLVPGVKLATTAAKSWNGIKTVVQGTKTYNGMRVIH